MFKKTIPYVAAAFAILAIGVGGYLAVGAREQAPSVAYTLLDGSKHTTADLRGKVVLVNFWATSCVTCMKEMPRMVETYDKYKAQGLNFVAVAMSYDPPNFVTNYAESRKLPFPVAMDSSGAIAKSFGDVQLTPTTFVLNKRGEIVKRYVGEPDFAALHQLVEQLLAEA